LIDEKHIYLDSLVVTVMYEGVDYAALRLKTLSEAEYSVFHKLVVYLVLHI